MSPRSRREYIEAIYLRYKRAELVIISALFSQYKTSSLTFLSPGLLSERARKKLPILLSISLDLLLPFLYIQLIPKRVLIIRQYGKNAGYCQGRSGAGQPLTLFIP